MTTDAVIAWVDGSDPVHQQRLAGYLAEQGVARVGAAHASRFNDAGEIEYCLGSILRFAPWFRRIHIVTDAQTPALMQTIAGTAHADRIRIVDHREIFAGFEQHLPTFNSRSICTMLWRIPELAENFVYFNDDMAMLQPVAEADFFRDGKVVLRGRWLAQSRQGWRRRASNLWKRVRGAGPAQAGTEREAQELSARLAGFEHKFYRLRHNPYPFRRSTMQAFFARNPGLLEHNIGFRLRAKEQFRAECLALHLEIAQGTAILDNRLKVVQLKPRQQSRFRIRQKMHQADRDQHAAFVCVQSLDMARGNVQEEITGWLDRRVGTLAENLRWVADRQD